MPLSTYVYTSKLLSISISLHTNFYLTIYNDHKSSRFVESPSLLIFNPSRVLEWHNWGGGGIWNYKYC